MDALRALVHRDQIQQGKLSISNFTNSNRHADVENLLREDSNHSYEEKVVQQIEDLSQTQEGLDLQSFSAEQGQQVIKDVVQYSKGDTVSDKALKKREKHYREKAKLQKGIKRFEANVRNHPLDHKERAGRAFGDYLQEREREKENSPLKDYEIHYDEDHKIRFSDPPNDGDKALKKELFDRLVRVDLSLNAYTDDKDFLSKYVLNKDKLAMIDMYRQVMENDEEYTDYIKGYLKTDDAAAIDAFKDQIKDKLEDIDKQREYIDLKFELIRNPYYALLTQADYAAKSKDELEAEAVRQEIKGNMQLKKYLETLAGLRELDIKHEKFVAHKSIVHTAPDTVVTKATRKNIRSASFLKPADVSFGPSADLKEKEEENKYPGSSKGDLKEEDGPEGIEELETLTLGYTVGKAEYTGLEHSIERKSGHVTSSASVSFLHAGAEVGGSLSFVGTNELVAEGSASAHLMEVEGSIGVQYGDEDSYKQFGASISGKATVGKVEAKGKVGVGLITFKNSKAQHVGFVASGKVGAYAASGKVATTINLFGVKITLKAAGSVGAGASAKYKYAGGRFKASVGAVLGVGGKLTLDIDFGDLINIAWKNKLKEDKNNSTP